MKRSKKTTTDHRSKSALGPLKTMNEDGARRAILEDLFYDFHSSRKQVYFMNFTRGLFFGFGSVLGATLLVTLLVWLLGLFGGVFPALADFLNSLIDTMQTRR